MVVIVFAHLKVKNFAVVMLFLLRSGLLEDAILQPTLKLKLLQKLKLTHLKLLNVLQKVVNRPNIFSKPSLRAFFLPMYSKGNVMKEKILSALSAARDEVIFYSSR